MKHWTAAKQIAEQIAHNMPPLQLASQQKIGKQVAEKAEKPFPFHSVARL